MTKRTRTTRKEKMTKKIENRERKKPEKKTSNCYMFEQ